VLNADKFDAEISQSNTCDCLLFLLYCFEHLDGFYITVTSAEYDHRVHDGSVYRQEHTRYADFNKQIYLRWMSGQLL
jgi:hypothetical protein